MFNTVDKFNTSNDLSYERNGKTIKFLEDIGTFDAGNPLEIRGAGGAIGKTSV